MILLESNTFIRLNACIPILLATHVAGLNVPVLPLAGRRLQTHGSARRLRQESATSELFTKLWPSKTYKRTTTRCGQGSLSGHRPHDGYSAAALPVGRTAQSDLALHCFPHHSTACIRPTTTDVLPPRQIFPCHLPIQACACLLIIVLGHLPQRQTRPMSRITSPSAPLPWPPHLHLRLCSRADVCCGLGYTIALGGGGMGTVSPLPHLSGMTIRAKRVWARTGGRAHRWPRACACVRVRTGVASCGFFFLEWVCTCCVLCAAAVCAYRGGCSGTTAPLA